MKVISIISSNRRNGNTERVCSLLEEELQAIAEYQHEILDIERIYLGHAGLKMCLGCRVCFDKGEEFCPLKDELLSIREKLNKADGVIAASPVYVEDVNGIMKNWIDRMAFNCHRPAFAGKKAVVLSTSGIVSTSHALKTMRTALMTWGFQVIDWQAFSTGALMETEQINNLYRHKIKRIAENFFSAMKYNKALRPSLYSLIMFRVQQNYWQKGIDMQHTFDYIYWKRNGWLKKDCNYYMDIKASSAKVFMARLLGSIIAAFFNK